MGKFKQITILGIDLLFVLFIYLIAFPIFAEDTESQTFQQDIETTTIPPEEEAPVEVEISAATAPIGIVDDIVITGHIVTSRGAILKQMTFKIGDEISKRDIDLCRRRLLGFNGLYWYAEITWKETEESGHIVVTVDLRSRRTWFFSPSISGCLIGDRNFLGTADTYSVAAFVGEDSYYYSVGWLNPQFNGGHNSLGADLHFLDGSQSIRTDGVFSTGESYKIQRKGISLNYGTKWNESRYVSLGYRLDDVSTRKTYDPYNNLGTDSHFYFSGQDIDSGLVSAISLGVGKGDINSFYFPTRGYIWNLNGEFSSELIGSDCNFSRFTISGTRFYNLYRNTNALCGRVIYSYLSGDPPNYELIPFGWQVRGYTGGVHRGKSMLAMNFEYRVIAEPDVFQCVLFTDLGQCWDGHKIAVNNLEYGYGMGIRINMGYFMPYNLIFRIDYGFGEYGEQLTYGFGHFF